MSVPRTALEPLRREEIPELLRHPGPCLSLRMPPYSPGAQEHSPASLLNTSLQEAARKLADHNVPNSSIEDLLQPLRELVNDPDLSGGAHWSRVIFRSPEVLRQFYATETSGPAMTLASCFDVRPILGDLSLPSEFYLLKLSKERVGLFRCANLRLEPVDLPKGVPVTLQENLAFDPPNHTLVNRSSSGTSTGNMRGVQFGTGSGRETQHTYLMDFYKSVDRGFQELLHNGRAPLVLVGVEEHASMYHAISTYANLLTQSIHGSPDAFTIDAELILRSIAILRAAALERAAKDVAEARERFAPARFSTNLDTILRAAVEGRVERLYLCEGARRDGVFERSPEAKGWGSEDLLNIAAVETLLRGGHTFPVTDEAIPDDASAAVFRY